MKLAQSFPQMVRGMSGSQLLEGESKRLHWTLFPNPSVIGTKMSNTHKGRQHTHVGQGSHGGITSSRVKDWLCLDDVGGETWEGIQDLHYLPISIFDLPNVQVECRCGTMKNSFDRPVR